MGRVQPAVPHPQFPNSIPPFLTVQPASCSAFLHYAVIHSIEHAGNSISPLSTLLFRFSFKHHYPNWLRNSNVLGRENENHLRETDVSDKCFEQNNLQNSASRVNHARSMIHMKEKPSGSFDLISSREGERVVLVTGDENTAAKRNAGRSGRSASCQSTREQVQQVPELDVHNGKVYNSFCGGSKELPVVEKLQEVLEQPNGVILVKNNEERKIASRAVRDNEVHNSNCKDLKITHGNEPLTETSREQDVSDQLLVLPCEPAKPLRCVVGTSGKKDDKSVACHSFRFQKQEQHYPYPSVPQLRRKKVPWSDAEEEALKHQLKQQIKCLVSDN
ncbi:hypothetical protein POM88_016532 [Heracleum sosnowskyi]|uniref:Uncharacterized protein n=1 Tax=Heracleum sosnowskyi TaxID=360622 RepID=A0AAD8MX67_9APIA|nr:hypothetical protein POM88_016532 [Heracleum sosnowskyi]